MKLSKRAVMALLIANFAGMVDLVALPIWVSALIAGYQLDPAGAGSLATAFLASGVLASILLAPRANRLSPRRYATIWYSLAAVALLGAAFAAGYPLLLVAHIIGGFGTGAGLTFVHSTIGRSVEPQRLIGLAFALHGVLGLVFVPVATYFVAHAGPASIFVVLAVIMAAAAVVSVLLLPGAPRAAAAAGAARRFPRQIWLGIIGFSCMALVQSMIFGFTAEVAVRVHQFSPEGVALLLTGAGVFNVAAALSASFLRNHIPTRLVLTAGPIVQAALAMGVMMFGARLGFVVSAVMFVGSIIITQTFVFGFMALVERSGRAVGSTPAMTMFGAALGPLVGGVLIGAGGFPALGVAAAVLGLIGCVLLTVLGRAELPADDREETLAVPSGSAMHSDR